MSKNADWRETYCSPDTGNARYPSSAKESVDGYAYIYTQDLKYLHELASFHIVQVWNGSGWAPFDGRSPAEREEPEGPPSFEPDEPEDPNW